MGLSSVAKNSHEEADRDTAGIDGKDPLTQYAVNLISKAAAVKLIR